MPISSIARLSLIVCILTLAACGFQLRGVADLSFQNLYIQGPKLSISKALNKSLAVNGVKIVEDKESADLLLEFMNEAVEKRILSLSGAGRVTEYDLFYRVHFRLRDPSNPLWGEVQTIEERRDFSYDDTQLLAKQSEEVRLNDDMRADAVREILRRLIVQKPAKRSAPSEQTPAASE